MRITTKAVLLALLMATVAGIAIQVTDVTVSSGASAKYTITYHVDEACGTLEETTQEYSGFRDSHPTPEAKEGYTFAGWYTYSNGTYSSVPKFIMGNYDLYAFWYYDCELTYVLNGGSLTESNPSTCNTKNLIQSTLGTPVYDGHKFYRWYTEEDLVTFSAKTTLTVNAVWYYNITYELNGGTNSYRNPSTYVGTETVILSDPSQNGYEFAGWVDEDGEPVTSFTMRDITVTATWRELSVRNITYHLSDEETYVETYQEGEAKSLYIPENTNGLKFNGWLTVKDDHSTMLITQDASVRGDVEYYAWWYNDDDTIGIKSTYEVTQVSSNSYQPWASSSVTVQVTLTTLARNDSGQYYMVRTVTSDKGTTTEGYWTEDDDSFTWTYQGMVLVNTEVYGQIYCEKWYGSGSTGYSYQYVYDGYIMVYQTSTIRSGQYTYATTYTLKASEKVEVEEEFDIVVTSDPGIKVSGSGKYHRGDTVTLVAEVSSGMIFSGWYDSEGNLLSSETTFTFDAYFGMKIYAKCASDTVVKTFTWKVGMKTYTYSLTMSTSDYNKSMSGTSVSARQTPSNLLSFITPDDRYVQEIASYILSVTKGMDQYDQMTVVLKFTQYIEYKYDSDSVGYDEFYKYPVETLFDMNGDCEDTSILFCAIASAMGYKSALLLFTGHAAGAVCITDGSIPDSSDKFPKGEDVYYYGETTSTTLALGKAPSDEYTYGGSYYQSINPAPVYHIHSVTLVPAVESTEEEEGIVEHYVCNECGKTFADEDCHTEILNVTMPKKLPSDIQSDGGSVTISSSDLDKYSESETVTIGFTDGYVDLPSELVSRLASSGSDVTVNLAVVDSSVLTDAQQERIGNNTAYYVELYSGSTQMHELGCSVTLRLAYWPGVNDDVSDLCVLYVDEAGNTQKMGGVTYADGYVTFTTDHFSIFEIAYDSSESSTMNFTPMVIAAIGVVLLGGIILRRRF